MTVTGGFAGRFGDSARTRFLEGLGRDVAEWTLEAGGCTAWCCTTDPDRSFSDGDRIVVVDGLAVAGNPESGYRLFRSEDYQAPFPVLPESIASNVNVISIRVQGDSILLDLASERAGAGRIYYAYTPDGIVFSSDFRLVSRFSPLVPDERAYYAIIKYGIAPDPLTIFTDIKSVPAMQCCRGSSPGFSLTCRPYFRLAFPESGRQGMERSKSILVSSASLLRSLHASVLVSGGVDSTLFAHYLDGDGDAKGYFLRFGEKDPELPLALAAAKSARIDLEIVDMDAGDVISAIKGAASSYMHPFADYSTIPTWHLMDRIRKDGNSGPVIDCTGADTGFSIMRREPPEAVWRAVFLQPRFLRSIEAAFLERSGLYRELLAPHRIRSLKFRQFLRLLLRSRERDIATGFLVKFPYERLLSAGRRGTETGRMYSDVASAAVDRERSRDLFNASVMAAMLLSPVRMMCEKTRSVGPEPAVGVVYPFLWRDILVESGELSWSYKDADGIEKFPLKLLLREFMPDGFVDRKKHGFVPPFQRWLADEEVMAFVRSVVIRDDANFRGFAPAVRIGEVLDLIEARKRASSNALHFVWAVLFSELWLEHLHRAMPRVTARENP